MRQASTISDQLRMIVRSRGDSPRSIAIEAGVAPAVLSRFLAGTRGMTLDSLDALAGSLGLRLVESIGRAPRRAKSKARKGAA